MEQHRKKDNSKKNYGAREAFLTHQREGRPKQEFVPEPYPGRLSSQFKGGTWRKVEAQ